MMSGNYISYEDIIGKALQYFPIDYELKEEDALEWIGDFMSHTNVPKVLTEKIEYVKVENGRAKLPSDMNRLTQIAIVDGVDTVKEAECGEGTLIPMRWKTDTFHLRYHCDSRDYTSQSSHTYTLNHGFVFPSFTTGILAIAYRAIPTDDRGYPMVPSDEPWRKGAMYEVMYRIATQMWVKEEMNSEKFMWFERERDWYFAQAVNYSKVSLPLDEMESQKNDHVRTIPKFDMHSNFFANMQIPEMRKFRRKAGSTSEVTTVTQQVPTSSDISLSSGSQTLNN